LPSFTDEEVSAAPAVERAIIFPDFKDVVAVETVEGVIACLAMEDVVSYLAGEKIVAVVAVEGVVATAAVEGVVACLAVEPVEPARWSSPSVQWRSNPPPDRPHSERATAMSSAVSWSRPGWSQ